MTIEERRVRWLAVGLAVLTVALFAPSWSYQMLFWDDDVNVLQNPVVTMPGWSGVRYIFTHIFSTDYYPVKYLSLGLDHGVWRGNFAGYHVTQTLLHAVNAGLVLLLVWRWTQSVPVAAVVALWFAWHPVQVETVAWVAERKSALGTLFVLLAWLAYPQRRLVSVGLFTLAALSHALVIVMPGLLLWYELTLNRVKFREALARTWLFFVPAGFAAVMRVLGHGDSGQLAHNFSHAAQGMMVMTQVIAKYLTTLVWPVNLNNFYVERPAVVWLVVALVWAAVWAVAIWRDRRFGWFGLGWFLIALLPVLQLVPHPTVRADRYLYLAMLGPWLVLARSIPGRAVWGVGVAGALALAGLTCVRLPEWRDGRTLWTTSVERDPNSSMAQFSVAGYLLGENQLVTAAAHARRAVELNPKFAEAHERLGTILLLQGNRAEAGTHLTRALELNPRLSDARRNLRLVNPAGS